MKHLQECYIMENLKRPCIDRKFRTLLKQTFVALLYSLVIMSITMSLLIYFFEDKCDHHSNFLRIHHIIIALLIVFVFNNMNALFLQLIQYLKIFPFFLYSWQCVVIESLLFSIFTYLTLFLDIGIPVTAINEILVFLLPETIILLLIIVFKYAFKRKYQLIEEEYTTSFNSMSENQKYSYSKIVDTALGLIIPSTSVLIFLTLLL